jgi:hypothetical protein
MCGLVVQNSRLIARIDSCVHISKDVSMQARWIAFRVKAIAGIQCAAISTEIQKPLGRIFAISSQGCLPPVSTSFYCLPHAAIDNDLRFLWIRATSPVRSEPRRGATTSPLRSSSAAIADLSADRYQGSRRGARRKCGSRRVSRTQSRPFDQRGCGRARAGARQRHTVP